MQNSLTEIPIFLYCLRTGLVMGIIYDVMRLFRIRQGKIVNGIGDVIFGLIAVALSALTLCYCDYGKLRLYEFLGLGLGVWLYRFFPSRLIRHAFSSMMLKIHGSKLMHGKSKRKKDG